MTNLKRASVIISANFVLVVIALLVLTVSGCTQLSLAGITCTLRDNHVNCVVDKDM